MTSAMRCVISAVIFGALGACSAGPSDEQIKDDFTRLSVSGAENRTINLREIERGDGWDDGLEGVVRYEVCSRENNERVVCERHSKEFSYEKLPDGSWKLMSPDQ